MVKHFVSTLLAASAFLTVHVQAQEAQPQLTPEQQAMADQLQGMSDQVRQNIQNSGIDPQQFAQQMRDQLQNDPQAALKSLVDQGFISQDALNQMLGTVKNLALSTIRTQLASTDEEWAVLQPKLLRVVNAMSDVDQNQVSRLAGRMFMNQQAGNNEMDQARARLKAAIDDPNASTEELTKSVIAWRAAHERAKAELAAAQADLTRILTLRQEGILLTIGVL